MRLSEAKRKVRPYGMTISKDPQTGEFRVNFLGGREVTAYYTDDLDDAVETAVAMSGEQDRSQEPTERKNMNIQRRF